ncbi:E3 ubiquitin-protein ligase hrd-like protein 1 [Toxocara canis]|uniref:E3 ubiquitin-protein ligase hrd-like protein 1 n=1 Tax=Toxocara canis TaxID=6265 RepID=A0A0B2V334_TOXCA|nr:E3 ubiquitin-protein ligase hrd-like protein 1 [Toxocara canis]
MFNFQRSLRANTETKEMPQIIFDPLGGLNSFVRQIPVPTLNSYIMLSVLLTFGSAYYMADLFHDNELNDMVAVRIHSVIPERFSAVGDFLASSVVFRQVYYSFLNPTSIWVSINAVCSLTAISGKILLYLTFGDLTVQVEIELSLVITTAQWGRKGGCGDGCLIYSCAVEGRGRDIMIPLTSKLAAREKKGSAAD